MPKGYRLPGNISPDGDRCLVVFIPDEERYYQAFWGAYEFLGYWFAWERDALRQGKDAAARWRLSVNRTHDFYDEYGDICQMNITLQQQQKQECGTCGTTEVIINNNLHVTQEVINLFSGLTPGSAIDNGQTPPSTTWPTYPAYQADKCALATKLADDYLQTMANLATWGGGMAGLAAIVQKSLITAGSVSVLLKGLMALGLSLTAAMSLLITALFAVVALGVMAMGYFGYMYTQMDRDALICAFFNATTEQGARDNINALTDIWGQESAIEALLGGSQFVQIMKQINNILLAPELLVGLFLPTTYLDTLPAGSCTNCDGAPPPPPPPDEGDIRLNLVHYWEFTKYADNGKFVDMVYEPASPEVSHLQPVNTTAVVLDGGISGNSVQTSNFNSAVRFLRGPSTDYYAPLIAPAESWTHAFWHKPLNLGAFESGADYQTLFQFGYRYWEGQLMCQVRWGGTLEFVVWETATTNKIAIPSNVLNQGAWNLVIIDYDADTMIASIRLNNGTPATTQLVSQHYPGTTYRVATWGAGQNTTALNWGTRGQYDEIAHWTRILTPFEQSTIWNMGAGLAWGNYSSAGGPA
jgi:hypothetical protein